MIEQINSKSVVPTKRPRLPTPGSAGAIGRGFGGTGARGAVRGAGGGGMGFGARGGPPALRGLGAGPMRGQWPRFPGGGPARAMRARGGGPMMRQGAMPPPWLMGRSRGARGGGPMQMAAMQQRMMAAAMQQQMAAAAYEFDLEMGGGEEFGGVDVDYGEYSYDGDDGTYEYDWFAYDNPYSMFMATQQPSIMTPPGNQFWQASAVSGPPNRFARPFRMSIPHLQYYLIYFTFYMNPSI